jgi:hypothetical protein
MKPSPGGIGPDANGTVMSRNGKGDIHPQYAMTGRAGDVTAAAIAQAAAHPLAQSKQPIVGRGGPGYGYCWTT